MKKVLLACVSVFLACIATTGWAQTSKEEVRLDKDASEINDNAGKTGGEKAVVGRLEKEFKVDDAMINNLRSQKLGYGEIAIVLALADKLPGGITTANVDKIVALRQGAPVMGWGAIAKKLGLKLGPVVSKVERTTKASKKDMEKLEREAGKSERMEHMEKMERPEKMEHPEMPMRK